MGDERAKILLEKAIEEASDETVYGRIAALISSGARNVHALERLKSYASRSIDTLRYQSRQGSFDSIYFERKFSHAGLKGTIDRCDEAVTPEGLFLDVIDYKSGNKSFDPDRIYYGLDIQLPLYMNAALQMRAASSGGRIVRPAGLFYYHVDDPVIEGARGSTEEEITEGIRKELRLRGVVNSDIAAVKAFDSEIAERGRSVVIPVGFKKDGGYEAAAKVYTEDELFSLMDHSIKLTKELREEITGGNVSRSPYSLGNSTGCDYCAYRDICDGGGLRRLAKHDFPAAWNTQKPE